MGDEDDGSGVGFEEVFLFINLSFTTFLKILEICLSRPLTPASLV